VGALGALCCCAAIAEGAITDWSGVYLRDQVGSSQGQAPLAFAAFSACMLAVRLRADRLKDAYGARLVVAAGAATAAAGLLLASAAVDVPATIAGFGVAGAGLAVVFPFIFSAAASDGPAAMAGVATLGYSGVLVGPPLIGFVAQARGLQAAVIMIALIAIAIAAGAARARSLD
jgi:MFS family permease